MSKLYQHYNKVVKGQLADELKIKNAMAVPKILKVVINTGLGESLANKKVIETMRAQIASISGQKPIVTRAAADISTFKLRRGDPIGIKVTLRGKRMYDFIEKLVKIVLPRIRDFRGVQDRGFDKQGNFTLGFTEQIVFPEIEYSQIDKIRGLEISFVTTAKAKKESKRLLELMGMPFKKEGARH